MPFPPPLVPAPDAAARRVCSALLLLVLPPSAVTVASPLSSLPLPELEGIPAVPAAAEVAQLERRWA
jgi:hypothetical protein